MSSIKEAVGANLSGYAPMETPTARPAAPMMAQSTPRANTFLRCPLPSFGADVDSIRQFEQGAGVPQIRIIPPPVATVAATTATASGQLVSSSSSSSSSSSTVTLVAASVTFNVGILTPLASISGTVAVLKKSFQLLSLSATAACDVRLYGTALAQLIDSSRATDVPVPAEISQNVITPGVIFDTAPFIWGWQNKIAANQDTPQTGTIYITVVNPDPVNTISGLAIVITYLPLES